MNIVDTRHVVFPARPSPGFDQATIDFYRDLVQPFGRSVDEDLLSRGGGIQHRDIIDDLIRDDFAYRPDLIVIAHALPDLLPFTVVGPYLDHRLNGGATCFGISQQGLGAPFTALRTALGYHRVSRSRLAVIAILEQTTLPSRHPVAEERELLDSGVILVLSEDAGFPISQVLLLDPETPVRSSITRHIDKEAGATLVILGASVDAGDLDCTVQRADARHYCTGVWVALSQASSRLRDTFSTIILCDTDPVSGASYIAVLRA
ncbi:hypothetical protein [Telmatospirillum siberiense]|nr:hypothetical protein [Telmatospirillum siberiense]